MLTKLDGVQQSKPVPVVSGDGACDGGGGGGGMVVFVVLVHCKT